MVNAQEWLRRKFPQGEETQSVILFVSNQPGTDQTEFVDCWDLFQINERGYQHKFYNLNLEGELDLSQFTKLINFEFVGQNNLTITNWWKIKSLRAECKEREVLKLKQDLATERASTQQALQTSQTWHERQKAEIIAEWKQKLTNLLNTRKQKITQELNLIREVLNE